MYNTVIFNAITSLYFLLKEKKKESSFAFQELAKATAAFSVGDRIACL